jgi:acetyl-CoA synthetase
MPIDRAQTFQDYVERYQQSINDPEKFWFEEGKRLQWIKSYTQAKHTSFAYDDFYIQWYQDGILNVSENCLDRHLPERADYPALIWQGDDPNHTKTITYSELFTKVCQFANGLKSLGINQGDRIIIYLPMILEAAVAMLACTRIGAVHSVVFGGFSPESLANRIDDCQAKLVITCDYALRGGKTLPFKHNTDMALNLLTTKSVNHVLVVQRTGDRIDWQPKRDQWYHDLLAQSSEHCPPTPMNAEDPLFILYTSGSTGKPKGILHTTGGYLVYAAMTFDHVFDYKDGDVHWCTADIGWITGHSYVIYGPLTNGATSLMFEGIPTYPTPERFWQIIDQHNVNIFYTAPTALRSLISYGNAPLESSHRRSLRLLGSVGEPIDPPTWQWFYQTVGQSRCPIVDTWWQTETGGILITPLPKNTPLKPGSATFPFYGIKPSLINDKGQMLMPPAAGNLVLETSWPGQARTIYGDHQRFKETYFSSYKGYYFTGDGARIDEEGYYWITGRIDDVINVSGHRLGTAEIEAVLDSHEAVIESAVVGFPHPLKGQGIYAYVVLTSDELTQTLEVDLNQKIREIIGPIASIDILHICSALPKTRSGKVMRRILRKIAAADFSNFGDISTLLDPTVVEKLIAERNDRH